MTAQDAGATTSGTNTDAPYASAETQMPSSATQADTSTSLSPTQADASNAAPMKLISGNPWRFLLFYDADFTERDGISEKDLGGESVLVTFNVRMAVSRPKFRVFLGTSSLIEHSPLETIAGIGTNGFVGPTLASTVALSRRLLWDFDLRVGYGADLARTFLDELEHCDGTICPEHVAAEQGYFRMGAPIAVADSMTSAVPAMDDMPALPRPETLVVNSSSQTAQTLGAFGSTGLSWQRTNRQRFSLRFSHAEDSFLNGNPKSNDIVSARATETHEFTPLTALSTYEQFHQYFQGSGCTFYGSGIGLWHGLSRSTTLEVEGGPEYGSHGCGQRLGLGFSGKLLSRIGKNTRVVLGGARDLSASYVVGSQWADYVEGSAIQQASAHTSIGLSAGYLRSASDFQSGSTYSGYFASPQFRWRLNRYWNLLASYRYFRTKSEGGNGIGGDGFAVNWIYISLQWRPSPVKL